jgi:formylmethanofuran:tetrahydromethanopterin formyltransferase
MGYARAREPFNFDLQPDTRLDQVFHMTSERVNHEPVLQTDAGYRIEQHEFTIFMARRTRRLGAWETRVKMHQDLDTALDQVHLDAIAGGYNVADEPVPEKMIQPPTKVGDFLVARLRFTVEFIRESNPS